MLKIYKYFKFFIKYPNLTFLAIFYIIYGFLVVRLCNLYLLPPRFILSQLGRVSTYSEEKIQYFNYKQDIVIATKKIFSVFYKLKFTNCMICAFAAKLLLKKYNISSTLIFGINKQIFINDNQEKIKNHVWLKCGNEFITGKKEVHYFYPYAQYN